MKSIFSKIVEAIEETEFEKNTFKDKAIKLCESIFNVFCRQGGDFHIYHPFPAEYLKSTVLRNEDRTSILKTLKATKILICDESYSARKTGGDGRSKGYKFNPELIKADGDFVVVNPPVKQKPKTKPSETFFTDLSNEEFKYSNSSIQFINNYNKSIQYYICFPFSENLCKTLNRATFDEKVFDYVSGYKLTREQILVDEEINDLWINLKFDGDPARYSFENALKFAQSQNLSLIKYKDLCYIDSVEKFLGRKTDDIKIIYRKSIFEIENGILRASRNETNKRLDYNLTNMKSDLLSFLRLDGEELVEIDVANCQFSILNFLFKDNLDENFSSLVKSGKLYEYVSDKLNIKPSEAKEKMFRVAFDKVKPEQDPIRNLFPKTMKFIDGFKKKYGYKSLSILLQNIESSIMIDGILLNLIKKNYSVLPIHDAFRVKKSDYNDILKEIELYFQSIEFECLPRVKGKKVKILYKGFKEVEIDEITKEDKKLFMETVNRLEKEWYGATEEILIDLQIFDKYKTSYLYEKLLNRKH